MVSGYARGVDTETHLGALESGGATIIVLAEGIEHFRHKKAFSSTGLPADRTCVVSQFPPKQSWTAGGAMTRNGTIVGLSKALVVVEAGEKGCTLNAGLTCLKAERPVLALEYGTRPTPTGNRVLIDKGAMPVKSTDELSRVLQQIGEQAQSPATQLQLLRPTLSDEAADSTA